MSSTVAAGASSAGAASAAALSAAFVSSFVSLVVLVVYSCVVAVEVSELDFFDVEEPHAPSVSASAADRMIAEVFFMIGSNQLGVI